MNYDVPLTIERLIELGLQPFNYAWESSHGPSGRAYDGYQWKDKNLTLYYVNGQLWACNAGVRGFVGPRPMRVVKTEYEMFLVQRRNRFAADDLHYDIDADMRSVYGEDYQPTLVDIEHLRQ